MIPFFPGTLTATATVIPCALLQAQMVLRDPPRFADQPSLWRIAQLVVTSANGTPARQSEPHLSKPRAAHPATTTPTGAA